MLRKPTNATNTVIFFIWIIYARTLLYHWHIFAKKDFTKKSVYLSIFDPPSVFLCTPLILWKKTLKPSLMQNSFFDVKLLLHTALFVRPGNFLVYGIWWTLPPPRCRKCENSRKFWKSQGNSGGPLGTLYNPFRPLEHFWGWQRASERSKYGEICIIGVKI